jgi:hypothetical protein
MSIYLLLFILIEDLVNLLEGGVILSIKLLESIIDLFN